jgi:hypothetical protein
MLAAVLLLGPCLGSTIAAGDACSLLTQMQVSGALGTAVEPGKPISGPGSCQWFGKGKFATLTVTQPLAGKSPVDRFNAAKAQTIPGVTKEPVQGVGDEAFFVSFSGTTRAGLGLSVRKGSAAFEVRVYGFDIDQAKPVARTLAQSVAGKI